MHNFYKSFAMAIESLQENDVALDSINENTENNERNFDSEVTNI